MVRNLILLTGCLLVGGCAAVAPAGAVLSPLLSPAPPAQITEQTEIKLDRNNFVLVKPDVQGRSRGFSLLGFVTIVPATVTKAMTRMYVAAQMPPGEAQTVAHLAVEHSSSYWILFGIPKVEVRGDVIQFIPKDKTK